MASPRSSAPERISPRVSHLLDVAHGAFAAHGYQHVSVDGIARASGVSKETIYRHFADKSALFEAALGGSRDAFSADIARVADTDHGTDDGAIENYALAIYRAAATGGHISATWLTVSSARSFPAVAARLHGEGLRRMAPISEALAARAAAAGRPGHVPVDHAADLGAMTVEGARHMMGWPWLEGVERAAHIAAVVRLFLHGCMAGGDSKEASERSALTVQPGNERADSTPALPPAPPPRANHIAALMNVAQAHFDAHGYRGASLDTIGAEARVGRGTLYRHFDGKAGLFEAVLLDGARQIAADAAALVPTPAIGNPPAVVLAGFARAAWDTLNSERALALYRTIIAESRRVPRLARQVYAISQLELMLPLTEYLTAAAADGQLRIDDADWHARQFLSLATEGNRPLSRIIPPDRKTRERTGRRAVATFLHGFAAALEPEIPNAA